MVRRIVIGAILSAALIVALFTSLTIAASTLDDHTGFLPLITTTDTGDACLAWELVNDPAFGLGTGDDDDYSAEEGFEVAIFKEQLYVGMESDNSMGARLWRTKAGVAVPQAQDDWEEVAADTKGNPFGVNDKTQADHIDSIAEFKGNIYASVANRSGYSPGTLVFRSNSGNAGSWVQVSKAGFGDRANTNFKDMRTFAVDGTKWLCGGTGNASAGAEIWCTNDGTTWEQKNISGFGDPGNSLIASTAVFGDALYVGVSNSLSYGSVWRTHDLVQWTQVYTAVEHGRVEVAGYLNGYLYIAEGARDGRYGKEPPLRIFRSKTGDAGHWHEVGRQVGHDANNSRTIVDGATVYNDHLYISTMNSVTGVEVWRTDGSMWTHVTALNEGFGDSRTFAAELIPFNGYMYAWTSNYSEGQRVRQTQCP